MNQPDIAQSLMTPSDFNRAFFDLRFQSNSREKNKSFIELICEGYYLKNRDIQPNIYSDLIIAR